MLVVAVVLALAAAYAARRALAREALIGWLEARGVPAAVEFREVELGRLAARLRIGSERQPDVTAELAEVRYGFTGFWSGQPLGVELTSVTLHSPVIRARYGAGKLSLGSLDPVIEEFLKKPPRPEARQPQVKVVDGVLRLDTDYGPLLARLDAQVADGRLMRLNARLSPMALRGKDLSLLTGLGALTLVTTRNQVDVALALPIRRLDAQGAWASDLDLKASARAAYPDFKRQRVDGDVEGRLDLSGKGMGLPGGELKAPHLVAALDGRATGWLETLTLRGDVTSQLTASEGELSGARLRAADVILHAHELKWTRAGGDKIAANLFAEAKAGGLEAGDVRLSQASAKFQGPGALAGGVAQADLQGGFASRGAWNGLGAPRAADPAETAALKRALQGFRLEATQVAVHARGQALRIDLGAPVTATTDTGGEAQLSPAGGPLYADGRGSFRLAVAGGGLPKVDLAVSSYRLEPKGLRATAALQASGGFGPVSDAKVDTAGELRVAGASTSFTASRCATFAAGRLDLGENDIEALDGRLCPTGAPLLTLADGAWRLRGRAEGLDARAPFLEARVSDAAGTLDFGGAGEALHGRADISAARVDDTAAERRFEPLRAGGQAVLEGGAWRAAFDVSDLAGHAIAQAKLTQAADGAGVLSVDTGMLSFAPEGLQPAALSPLADAVGSPVTGQARFTGEVGWTSGGSTSHGVLEVPGLDFLSPAGPVSGLSGRVEFASLVPLAAAPGQVLKARAIETLVPLTGAEVSFGLADEAVQFAGVAFDLGGGKVTLEPFAIPFAPGASWKGVLVLDGVQISDIIESSPFGDQMDMTAKLTGRVPFAVTPEGVRISGGTLRAIEPGRLSIRREALTGVKSEGGQVTETPPAPVAETVVDPYSDFVYQALENLAFSELDAKVDSEADGRLGVRFHIEGEHSPPKAEQIKLTLREIISRQIQRALPLPKGTKVDLTLDTSVNLDQLLADFANYQALRGSDTVQP